MTLKEYRKRSKVGEVLTLDKDASGRTTASQPVVVTVSQLKVGDKLQLVDRRKNGLGQGIAVVVGIFQPLPGAIHGKPMAVLLGIENGHWSSAYYDIHLKRCEAQVIDKP